MNTHRPKSAPSSSSLNFPGLDHRGASPTTLLVCLASSIVLAGLALLIQSDSPVIPATIRTCTRLWKSAAGSISDEQDEQQRQQKKPSSSAMSNSNAGGQRSRQSNPQSQPSSLSQSPTSKRGGRKQQRRRLNKDARAAAAVTETPATGAAVETEAKAVEIGASRSSPSSVPIVQTPQPPLHKSLHARMTTPPTTPSKQRKPSANTTASPQKPKRQTKRPVAKATSSYSDILSSILNPRAAVYEFRAQYHQDPLSSLTTTATNTPLPAPQQALPPATAFSPQPTSLPLPVSLPTTQSPYYHQIYDAILVLDVEATCAAGSTFDYPNEIIEWPVLLMRWVDEDTPNGTEQKLVIVDDFRSYVRPTWRPQLTDFCKSLTGINQVDINVAPTFPEMLVSFESWLQKHGLIPPPTALLTPPASRCASPVPAMKRPPTPPSSSSTQSSYTPPLLECTSPMISPSITISLASSSSSSSSSSSGSSSTSSTRSSYSAAASSSSAMTSPAPTYASLFSPSKPLPMALQPEVVYENSEWDEYGQGGYGYGYQAEGTGPRFAWATDGPCDLRDFVVKQCFISKIPIPEYFLGDVIDVRRIVGSWVETTPPPPPAPSAKAGASSNGRAPHLRHGKRQSLNIPLQLQALALGSFSGQQHRGIDDARNISRIMQALSAKGVQLEGNMYVNPNRRWFWMGAAGEVVLPPSSVIAAIVPPPTTLPPSTTI
ncbi:hypothetical protein FRB97_001879 [Tulasnella sp. 331]|nr:hypothetical protein FRB97_001879 [Tulasnella sp. 331]